MDRRSFLSSIIKVFSFATGCLLALPPVRFITGSLAEQKDSIWRSVLKIQGAVFPEDVTLVRIPRIIRDGWLKRTSEEFVWVRRKPDRTFEVFDVHCTHLGCAVNWNSEAKQFQCPCHGGKYDIDGKRVAGPPPRPLDQYATRIEGESLQIGDLRKKV
jgi:menaquinol-cytochrome c reductase iron-sulfur subunit